jgi:hypothetical protein
VGELFEYQEKTQALAVKAVEERAARGARAAPAKKTAACREGGSSGGDPQHRDPKAR